MNKKKIAIIELETHAALLEQWYFLLKEMKLIECHFFISQKIKDRITAIPEDKFTLVQNAAQIDNQVEKYDAFVVTTFHRNFEDYRNIFKRKPTLIIIHNINFSLFYKFVNLLNLWTEKESFLYYLKLYFLEKVSFKRNLVENTSNYGVLSTGLFQTITSKNNDLAVKTQVVSLNYCKETAFIVNEYINIVLPGTISRKRKDIDLVFKVIAQLQPKGKLKFTFLGKPASLEIEEKLEQLKQSCHQNIKVHYYSRYIPWEEYLEVMDESHLLLCPIKINTAFYWVDEVYGETKMSGAEIDCITSGKIGLFPSEYPKMNWHNLYYDNQQQLLSFFNKLSFKKLKEEYQNLHSYKEMYTFEKVKTQLETQLLALIDSK